MKAFLITLNWILGIFLVVPIIFIMPHAVDGDHKQLSIQVLTLITIIIYGNLLLLPRMKD